MLKVGYNFVVTLNPPNSTSEYTYKIYVNHDKSFLSIGMFYLLYLLKYIE